MELLSRYSNRQAQIEGMEDVLCRIAQGDQTTLAGGDHLHSRARTWRVEDRLSAEQLDQLVAMFTAGTPKTVLAERFNISLSSVKRLLRRYGVRRPGSGEVSPEDAV